MQEVRSLVAEEDQGSLNILIRPLLVTLPRTSRV